MLAHVYSNSYIQRSSELNEIIRAMLEERLVPLMHSWARDGASADVLQETKAYAMDVSTAYFFGCDHGTNFIEEPEQKSLLRSFELAATGLFWLTEAPRFASCLRVIGIRLIPDSVFGAFQAIEKLCMNLCMNAKSRLPEKRFVDDIHCSRSRDHPAVYAQLRLKLEESGLAHEELDTAVAAEMLDHMFASHETSGITLTYLICELSRQPSALRKLQQELLTLQDLHQVWSDPAVIDNLKYLDAVIMETLRLYAAAPGPFPRVVPAEGVQLSDFANIPAGTTVSASPYSLHRNPEAFPEPERWIPERWLEADARRRLAMHRWFWAFGSGGRMCIGNHLAFRSKQPLCVELRIC